MKKTKLTSSIQLAIFGLAIVMASSMASAQEVATETGAKKSREEVRQAFETCATSLGLERPARGQRPPQLDDATKEALDACLVAAGVDASEIKKRHDHRHQGEERGPRPERSTSSQSESSGGIQ